MLLKFMHLQVVLTKHEILQKHFLIIKGNLGTFELPGLNMSAVVRE